MSSLYFNNNSLGYTKLKQLLFLPLCFAVCISSANAFELLTEGAMGSVSAVSAESADELVNVAGSSAAGLRIGGGEEEVAGSRRDEYEALPFETGVSVAGYETDEVSRDLNFVLTQEVEAWAESLRLEGRDDLEVGVVDEVAPSSFESVVTFDEPSPIENTVFDIGPDEENAIIVEIGRIEQTVQLLESNVDSVRFIVERVVDRAVNLNARAFPDAPSIGSTYITDLRGVSNVSIAAIRD